MHADIGHRWQDRSAPIGRDDDVTAGVCLDLGEGGRRGADQKKRNGVLRRIAGGQRGGVTGRTAERVIVISRDTVMVPGMRVFRRRV